MSPRARDIKENINKGDYIELGSFCMAKENISKIKREPTIWENILASDALDNSLILKTYENSHKSTPRRQRIQLKNGQRN